jgi:hypothetical protein
MRYSQYTGVLPLLLLLAVPMVAQTHPTAATTSQTVITSVKPTQLSANSLDSTQNVKATAEESLRLEEDEVKKSFASVEQLRQLYSDGLIARIELEKAQQGLAAESAKVEAMRNEIAASDRLAAEIKKAEELAKAKPALVKPTLLRMNLSNTATILSSSSTASWSIGNLGSIQQFFANRFGHALPTTAIGQSATHDRLGYDHRNAVDVGLNPDSLEGRALISYLQSTGIPFLAFRSAIPGVATGPHIHIGSPSHRTG